MRPTGGSDGRVNFLASLHNHGDRLARVTMSATVGGHSVQCQPPVANLLVNQLPTPIQILAPRPDLGELMKECNSATTLYGRELHVEAERSTASDDP